ncbi:Hydrolase, NUDIX domain containing protein [Balamuthia mandrillaris]
MDRMRLPLVEAARQADERTFIAVHSWTAANSAHTRLACFDKGANMVTASTSDLLSTLTVIAAQGTNYKDVRMDVFCLCKSFVIPAFGCLLAGLMLVRNWGSGHTRDQGRGWNRYRTYGSVTH